MLTPRQVEEKYGHSRSSLLRWEQAGVITPHKTPGGQRRYTDEQIQSLTAQTGTTRVLPYREYGTTGISRWGGQIYEEKLKELRGREGYAQYREMRRNDPVIGAVMFGIISALKDPDVEVIPASDSDEDRIAARFVETCIYDMSFSWADTLDLILNPLLEQGFALVEICYKRRLGQDAPAGVAGAHSSKFNDGRIGWRKWAPRPAESLAPGNEWIYDKNGGIQGINQQPETPGYATKPLRWVPGFRDVGTEDQDYIYSIPIEKLLHFRTSLYPANNPEGVSLLRSMYIPYWYSMNMQEIEGIGVERDLNGLPVMYLGEGTTLGDDSSSDFTIAKELVENIRTDEQAGVVIPHPKLGSTGDGRGVLLELLSTQGRRQWDVGQIIERYDKRKAISVLAQFIMLGMDTSGSFSLGKVQSDLFMVAVKSFMKQIADVINRHAIPRLMAFNYFPGTTGYPYIKFSPVGIPSLAELAEFVNKLVDKQVLIPDDDLERHLRQVADLPVPIQQFDEAGRALTSRARERQQVTEQARGAEETALVLRRMALSVDPLVQLGAMSYDEGVSILHPLIEELKQKLGARQGKFTMEREELEKSRRPFTEVVDDLLRNDI